MLIKWSPSPSQQKLQQLAFDILFNSYFYSEACVYAHVCADLYSAQRSQRRALDALELKL